MNGDRHQPHGIPASTEELRLMGLALAEAQRARDAGEIPVGAIIFSATGEIIAAAHNEREHSLDPTGHAEILAIRRACEALADRYLEGSTLVVTLEPCVMCAGVIRQARLTRVIFGAWDEKAGASGSVYDILRDARLPCPPVEVIAGVRETETREILEQFFQERR